MKIIDNYWHKKYNGSEYFKVFFPSFTRNVRTLVIGQIRNDAILLVEYKVVEFGKQIQKDDVCYLFDVFNQTRYERCEILVLVQGFKHADKFRNPLLNIHMEIWN